MDDSLFKNTLSANTDNSLKVGTNYSEYGVDEGQMAGKSIANIFNANSPYDHTDDSFWPAVGKIGQTREQVILQKRYPTIYGDIAEVANSGDDD